MPIFPGRISCVGGNGSGLRRWSARPSRERKRPSVCGFRPLPLASPGKGRSFQQPPLHHRSPPRKRFGPLGSSVEPPSEHPVLVDLRPRRPTFRTSAARPTLRPSRPLERLSAPAPSIRPSAQLPFPPSPLASRHRDGLAFRLGLSALSGTQGPLVSPGEAGGSPWLRDHFDTGLNADNRPSEKGCARTGA